MSEANDPEADCKSWARALDRSSSLANFSGMRLPCPDVLVCALLMTAWPLAAQDDWPEFRGPTGQGHADSRKLPLRWSPSENIVWKRAVPGVGWSSPVVHRGVIYLTTALLDDAGNPTSLRALAHEVASGRLLWNQEVFPVATAPGKHSKNSDASPTPVVAGDQVFVHFGHLGTAALEIGRAHV